MSCMHRRQSMRFSRHVFPFFPYLNPKTITTVIYYCFLIANKKITQLILKMGIAQEYFRHFYTSNNLIVCLLAFWFVGFFRRPFFNFSMLIICQWFFYVAFVLSLSLFWFIRCLATWSISVRLFSFIYFVENFALGNFLKFWYFSLLFFVNVFLRFSVCSLFFFSLSFCSLYHVIAIFFSYQISVFALFTK